MRLLALLPFLKAHNKGYTKKDGTFVAPFDDKRAKAAPAPSPAPKHAPTPKQQALQDELSAAQEWDAPPKPAPAKKPGKWSAISSISQSSLFGGSKPAAPKGVGLFGGFMSPQHAKDVGQKPLSPFGAEGSHHKPLPDSAVPHPRAGDKGERVMIHYPSKPTGPETWTDPEAIATFTPGSAVPAALHGVALAPWADAPTTEEGWDYVDGQNEDLEEPAMELTGTKVPASGVIVMEPDGRAWVIAPTNRFGAVNTFPKGGREYGLSLQANAIKEAFEESGLKVEIDSFLGDIPRSTSVARYYLARRVGGTPAAMGWESQAVRLVPVSKLRDFLDRGEDKKVAEWLEALNS